MGRGKQETAFVLSAESAARHGYTGVGPFHFSNFPGSWTVDVPIAARALGFATVTEADHAIEEAGLPLTRRLVPEGSAPMPVLDGHATEPSQPQTADPATDADEARAETENQPDQEDEG